MPKRRCIRLEVKINKEIRNYTESMFFGLSLRQFIFSLLACGVAVGLYFILRPYFGIETLSWVCILGAAPFAVMEMCIRDRYRTVFRTVQFLKAPSITMSCLSARTKAEHPSMPPTVARLEALLRATLLVFVSASGKQTE